MNAQEEKRPPEKMINVGIFAHVDAGKTTLTEQLLLACGRIRQAGAWMPVLRRRIFWR